MNIYSPKFMNEASCTLKDKVIRKQNAETYLFSTLGLLREMNSTVNENTKNMYIQISEAESKEEENKIFADYFYQFKKVFQDFSNKVQEMKSRMVISIENKMETWEDLIKDDQYISSFDKDFSYNGWEFFHINDSDYPRLDLNKIYQKEFNYIAQLMQNSSSSSSTEKLKIIAAVSNNFISSSGDKDWIKNIIKDMVDIDDKELSRSYSEIIYNSLRDKYEINVDKGMLYTCKERLTDYEDAVEAASKLCDNLLIELDSVAENISSYLFRNEDKKLKIKTDEDGIIDRDYRLDTYSMNQLNLFLKNKVNQMRKVLNIFTIAIGIKFDTVVDYITQYIEILQTAKDYYNNAFSDDEEFESDEDHDDEDEDDEDHDDEDEDDEDHDDEDEDDEDHDDEDEDHDDEDNIPGENLNVDDSSEEYSLDNDSTDFEEAYLFESELFELELMQETSSMHNYITKTLMLEEDQNNDSNLQNVQKLASQQNTWQKIISKLIELWKRFKEAVIERSESKIKYIKDNQKYLYTKGVKGTFGLPYTPNIDALRKISIPDLNYGSMKDSLNLEDDFISKYGSSFLCKKGEGSVTDQIKKAVLNEDKPQTGKTVDQIVPPVDKMKDFIITYADVTNNLKKQTDAIEKAQRVARDVSKVAESSVSNRFEDYFTEALEKADDSNNNASGNNNDTAKQNGNKEKHITLYFRICSQVLAAEMTCYQKLFNVFYIHCRDIIKLNGGASNNNGGDNNNQNQTKSADQSTQSFN